MRSIDIETLGRKRIRLGRKRGILDIFRQIKKDGKLEENTTLSIDSGFFSKPLARGIAVRAEGKLHFIEKEASLTDGLWLVEIEGTASIRDLTLLPGKKLHVAGGKVPFECGIDEIKTVGRVVGIYSEVN